MNRIIHNPGCPQTVRNTLKMNYFKAVVKAKSHFPKARHRQRRLYFALYHQNQSIKDCIRVIWSYETYINSIQSHGKQYMWERQSEPIFRQDNTSDVKYRGGNIMVWGCLG
jgi:hypothetical protein